MAESENSSLNNNLPFHGSIQNTRFTNSNVPTSERRNYLHFTPQESLSESQSGINLQQYNRDANRDQYVDIHERVRNHQRSYSDDFISSTNFNQSFESLNYAVTSSNVYATPSNPTHSSSMYAAPTNIASFNNVYGTPSSYNVVTPSNNFSSLSNNYQSTSAIPPSNIYRKPSNTYRTASNIYGTPSTTHVTSCNSYGTPTTNHVTSWNINKSPIVTTSSNNFINSSHQHTILQHQSSEPNFQVTSPTNYNNSARHSISVDDSLNSVHSSILPENIGYPSSNVNRPLSNCFRPDNSARVPLPHNASWNQELNPSSCSISEYLYQQNESMFRLYNATNCAVKDEERLKEDILNLESQINSLPRVQSNSSKLDYLHLQEENKMLESELKRMFEDLDKLGVPIPSCKPTVPVEIDENWICPQCTFSNLALPKCEMCECLRPVILNP